MTASLQGGRRRLSFVKLMLNHCNMHASAHLRVALFRLPSTPRPPRSLSLVSTHRVPLSASVKAKIRFSNLANCASTSKLDRMMSSGTRVTLHRVYIFIVCSQDLTSFNRSVRFSISARSVSFQFILKKFCQSGQ
jgi:hypothetical protein